MLAEWRDSILEWAQRRAWLPRALLLPWLLWIGVRVTADPGHWTIFAPIDLGIHEAGHLVFRFGGERICAFGGTLLQCAVPLLAAVALARRPDWFGVAFCAFWLGVNLHEVSNYVADARAQLLPLVTVGGGDARHDWAYLLGELGLLRADAAIAGLVRVVGFLVLWSAIAGCVGLVVLIARRGRAAEQRPPIAPMSRRTASALRVSTMNPDGSRRD